LKRCSDTTVIMQTRISPHAQDRKQSVMTLWQRNPQTRSFNYETEYVTNGPNKPGLKK